MSNMIEAQGVTVDEAIQLALNQLGVGRDSVEIKILHHPRGGFLGIGARRATVRATVREDALKDGAEFDMSEGRRNRRRRVPRHRRGGGQGETKSDDSARPREPRGADSRRDSGRGGGRENQAGDNPPREDPGRAAAGRGSASETESEPRPAGSRNRGNRRGGRGRQSRGGRGNQAAAGGDRVQGDQASGSAEAERAQGDDKSGGDRRRSGGRDRQRDASQSAGGESAQPPVEAAPTAVSPPPVARPDTAVIEPTPTEPAAEPMAIAEIRERAEEIVSEMLRLMGFEATVGAICDDDQDEVVVQVHADAEGLLIGRRGQTLDAFEHLVNRSVAAREMSENRVVIDVGGYRDRRRESLLELAGRLKERAMREGRRVQVSPMSPRDRKVFQDAFGEDADVTTRALGTGFYRRVLIIPEGAADERAATADADREVVEPGDQSD